MGDSQGGEFQEVLETTSVFEKGGSGATDLGGLESGDVMLHLLLSIPLIPFPISMRY